MAMPDPRIIVALDFADGARAMALVDRLDRETCALKIGKELFVSAGPDLVRTFVARGFKVFLDLKFHDIPNTVAQACAAATRLGVWMLNVHAAGGRGMLIAARESVIETARVLGRPTPRLVAVTVLTSLGQADLDEVGLSGGTEGAVLRLAKLANLCGLDGVVCSALEAKPLRRAFGPAFILVTPGIRPAGSASADQARIVTPEAAVAAGADFLVIGRPITEAPDPVAALGRINAALGVPA